MLAWGILNFFWLAVSRRPAFAAALSLLMMTVLVLLSQLKYHVLMMTANFVDLMIVDTDTVSFLFTIFPALRWIVGLSAAALIPLIVLTWWFDPFRVRRLTAVGLALICLGAITALETHFPLAPFEAFNGANLVSSFARSRRRRDLRTRDPWPHGIGPDCGGSFAASRRRHLPSGGRNRRTSF